MGGGEQVGDQGAAGAHQGGAFGTAGQGPVEDPRPGAVQRQPAEVVGPRAHGGQDVRGLVGVAGPAPQVGDDDGAGTRQQAG